MNEKSAVMYRSLKGRDPFRRQGPRDKAPRSDGFRGTRHLQRSASNCDTAAHADSRIIVPGGGQRDRRLAPMVCPGVCFQASV